MSGENNRQFHSFDTDNAHLKDSLREFLHDQNVYYELSDCFDGWHFEVRVDHAECDMVNSWLDKYYEGMRALTIAESC